MNIEKWHGIIDLAERLVKLIAPYFQRGVGAMFVLAMCWVKLFYPDRLSNETLFTVVTLLYSAGWVNKRVSKPKSDHEA